MPSAVKASARHQVTACAAAAWERPATSNSWSMAHHGPRRSSELGDPKKRGADLVLLDVRNGLLSAEAARTAYGVAIASDGRSVDTAGTRMLRGG